MLCRFDEEMIELLFGYNGKCLTRNEEVRAKNPSPGLSILELKRLQNITILLKALNATIDDVHHALMLGKSRRKKIYIQCAK